MTLALDKIHKVVAGEPHLIDVSLTLTAGAMNVLLGHTNAGKTSLLRVLAGLDRPTSGAVRQDGVDITKRTARDRSVAMVYQQFINYPSLSVRDNIASPLKLKRAKDVGDRVVQLAKLLRIEPLLDRLPGALSGGQQQRVAIARALAKGAELVLLDEPLVNLDYKLREDLRDELRALFGSTAAGPVTVVYATTDPAEALALGGSTIVIDKGRVLQHAPTLEVYHRPATVSAARVFSDPPMNLIDGVVAGGEIVFGKQGSGSEVRVPLAGGAHLAGLADGDYAFGIRASDCGLDTGTGVAIPARVELSEISGSETYVYLRGEREPVQLVVQQAGVYHHQLDDARTCYLDPGKLLAFRGDGTLVASYRPSSVAVSDG